MERFKIFPSIGIARVGGSQNQFFVCPENEKSFGIEIDDICNETELRNFKDSSGLIKRQAARFKVFELDASTNEYKPVDMSKASIEWQVHLVNKKSAAIRPTNPQNGKPMPPLTPPDAPLSLMDQPKELIIDGGVRTISGKCQKNVFFKGQYKTSPVDIGELKTDRDGNLLVLGGYGVSKSPSNESIKHYYYSKDWYDDVSDGYVNAKIKLQDGSFDALTAWVIVAPPDYAPNIKGIVTLYDIMEQVALEKGYLQPAQKPSFSHHILPIIEGFKNLSWVSDYSDFSIPYDLEILSDVSETNLPKRKEIRTKVLGIEGILEGHTSPGHPFQLTPYQKANLTKWENGEFLDDLKNPVEYLKLADRLNKIILDTTVGQGFCPGIEGGIITANPKIYLEAFRFDPSKITPGDITGLMALPWQADFLKCNTNWWPTQRPDKIFINSTDTEEWIRGIETHESLIANFDRLGYVKPRNTGAGVEQIEDERTF